MIAEPFPHVILKPHWSERLLRDIAAEFPDYYDPRWRTYPDGHEIGKKAGDESMWGPETARWFEYVRSPEYVGHLERLTGIQGLVADTWGGGMHCTGEGGRLALHTDFSVHPRLPGMVRRINHLTFLNPEWEKKWGGVLCLGENREVEILPLNNTTVIFETSHKSFHGHPDPIVGNHIRKSVAVYYWAPARGDEVLQNTTVWKD